jgi:hypothetical protein
MRNSRCTLPAVDRWSDKVDERPSTPSNFSQVIARSAPPVRSAHRPSQLRIVSTVQSDLISAFTSTAQNIDNVSWIADNARIYLHKPEQLQHSASVDELLVAVRLMGQSKQEMATSTSRSSRSAAVTKIQ